MCEKGTEARQGASSDEGELQAMAQGSDVSAYGSEASLAREVRVRDALIHEVHHRVKNNLQTVESLMRLHIRRCDSEEARNVLEEASCRLRSMAVVHAMLSEAVAERVDAIELARKVAAQVKLGLCGDTDAFRIEVLGRPRLIPGSMATSLALVIAEITHNSFEHGFSGRGRGEVRIVFEEGPERLAITICDNGRGLPPGFDLDSPASMGLTLMKTLVEDDLRGRIEAVDSPLGACFLFTVPNRLLDEAGASQEEHA